MTAKIHITTIAVNNDIPTPQRNTLDALEIYQTNNGSQLILQRQTPRSTTIHILLQMIISHKPTSRVERHISESQKDANCGEELEYYGVCVTV